VCCLDLFLGPYREVDMRNLQLDKSQNKGELTNVTVFQGSPPFVGRSDDLAPTAALIESKVSGTKFPAWF
jgi:hypothetical protein